MTLDELVEKVKEFEGFSSKAYEDPGGTLTIGFGRISNIKAGEVTTPEKETKWLRERLADKYETVSKTMILYNLSEDQLLALTDFLYNLGYANFLKLIDYHNRSVSEIAQKMLEYDKCRGVRLAGLTKRRKWEYELFTGIEPLTTKDRIKKIQSCANTFLKKSGSSTVIDEDGIIGNATLSALQECFNLIK